MITTQQAVFAGQPRFLNPDLAALQAKEGTPSAWSAAFAGDHAKTVAEVAGGFAVGIRDANGRAFMAVDP